MSERLFIWNVNTASADDWYCPWNVSVRRTRDPMDFLNIFKTLPEAMDYAHQYAKGYKA